MAEILSAAGGLFKSLTGEIPHLSGDAPMTASLPRFTNPGHKVAVAPLSWRLEVTMRVALWGIVALTGCNGSGYTFTDPGPDPGPPGDAKIELSVTALEWFDIEPGKANSQVVVLHNVGDAPLRISRAAVTGVDANQFYAPPEYKNLVVAAESAEAMEFTVVCSPNVNRKIDAVFRIESNALDQAEVDVTLTGYPVGWVEPDTDTDVPDTDTDA